MSVAAPQPEDEEQVAADVARRIFLDAEVKPESFAALLHALFVSQADGVGGTLVVKLPRKTTAPIEVSFTTGSVTMRIEP